MKKGFTLIELLIVIIIIAILAAIVIPKFQEMDMDEVVYAIVKHDNVEVENYEIIDIRDDDQEAWAIAHALADHPGNKNPGSTTGLFDYYVEEYSFNGLEVPSD